MRAPLGQGGQLLGFGLELGIPGSLGQGLQGGELLFSASSRGSQIFVRKIGHHSVLALRGGCGWGIPLPYAYWRAGYPSLS